MKRAPAKSCPSCGERYGADVLFCPRDGTPLASSGRGAAFSSDGRDPYLGMELAGQLRLQHLIGIGSMGRVYRAFQGGIDRDVAVKILHRELSGNTELVSRFHREAKIASRLVHPNVVQVLMTGSVPPSSDARVCGELYLVMEYLDGISLLSALAAAGTAGEDNALPLPRALHVILQICDAVGEAHAQGIVHRDLKPENVMLIRRGDDPDYVKVLDFGIARLDRGDMSMATQAGLIFGTAKYISPEGAEGQPVGPQADVYSIATMLYECLAGRPPFEGDSPVALLVQHTHTPPTDLRSIARASYVPAPIAQVVMQSLSKKPGDRPRDARALGRDLVLAARASGLDPDEIAAQPSVGRGLSVVKLASKARTRALELSPELAARIGGVAAPPPAPDSALPPIGGELLEGAEPPTPSDPSTMQGVESEARPQPRRARPARLVALLAFVVATVFIAVFGGLRLRSFGDAGSDSLDAQVDRARDCVRRHAWDAPPGENVKEITDRALARWPADPRVAEIRREASERIVTEALGRKYAGDRERAIRLAKLALELQPALTTAQHLLAELEGGRARVAPAVAPVTAAPLPSSTGP